ncbi:MAG TPA: hypothetical protein VFM11_09830 [Burkholderiales bacterium]|nr:hypothetical protein [Burkholderiales bacterium]
MQTTRMLFLTLALSVAAAPAMAATAHPSPSQTPQPPQVFPSEPGTAAPPDAQLNDRDIASIIAWIKQAMDDAANGKTVEVPPEMRHKLEAMGQALKKHSIDLSNALLDNLREQIRRLQRENPPPQQLPIQPPATIQL